MGYLSILVIPVLSVAFILSVIPHRKKDESVIVTKGVKEFLQNVHNLYLLSMEKNNISYFAEHLDSSYVEDFSYHIYQDNDSLMYRDRAYTTITWVEQSKSDDNYITLTKCVTFNKVKINGALIPLNEDYCEEWKLKRINKEFKVVSII